MIADPEIEAGDPKRNDLVIDKILPRILVVGLAAERLASLLGRPSHIFVDLVDRPKVSQVPVKSRLVFFDSLRSDCRHDDVATVPRVPGRNINLHVPSLGGINVDRFCASWCDRRFENGQSFSTTTPRISPLATASGATPSTPPIRPAYRLGVSFA